MGVKTLDLNCSTEDGSSIKVIKNEKTLGIIVFDESIQLSKTIVLSRKDTEKLKDFLVKEFKIK